jgi:uncharacterized protein
MELGLLILRFHLEGCDSLKEKRQRLSGLRDRFGRLPQVGVCESDLQDTLDKAEYTFSCLGQTLQQVNTTLAAIEEYAATSLDAVILERRRERL